MASSSWPKSETELGPPLVSWLEANGWRVYQEVQPHSYDSICDIVAVQGPLLWTIEMKRTLSLEVINQAWWWRQRSHFSSVAVPRPRNRYGHQHARLVDEILDWKGIGLLSIAEPPPAYYAKTYLGDRVREDKESVLNRKAKTDKLRAALCDEQRTYAPAGSCGQRWTPFQSTCKALHEVVCREPGIVLKEAIGLVKHHYASSSSAVSSLTHWLDTGKVAGVELRREGRLLKLYPKEENHEQA
jgi:hypothetical protein